MSLKTTGMFFPQKKGNTKMKITNIDGARLIREVINKYCQCNYDIWRRAMYANTLRNGNCLWFPQVSRKLIGTEDDFRPKLSAENWLPADGTEIWEKPKSADVANCLTRYNGLRRIVFANTIPDDGYWFVGEFKYVGDKRGYRVYERIAATSDTATW